MEGQGGEGWPHRVQALLLPPPLSGLLFPSPRLQLRPPGHTGWSCRVPAGESEGQGAGALEAGALGHPSLPSPTFALAPQGNGQCFCKPHVCGQTCAVCKDGFFGLGQAGYFGCRSECPPPGPSDHVWGAGAWGDRGVRSRVGSGHGVGLMLDWDSLSCSCCLARPELGWERALPSGPFPPILHPTDITDHSSPPPSWACAQNLPVPSPGWLLSPFVLTRWTEPRPVP